MPERHQKTDSTENCEFTDEQALGHSANNSEISEPDSSSKLIEDASETTMQDGTKLLSPKKSKK